MVADVVAIVPALVVELHIDHRNAVLVIVAGIVGADEGVLYPIACHCHQAKSNERKDEGHQGRLPIQDTHGGAEQDEKHFTARRLEGELFAFAGEEVLDQRVDAGEEKGDVVLQEVLAGIPLVWHGAAFGGFQVVLHMVHAHMVSPVGFR